MKSFIAEDPNCSLHMSARLTILRANEEGFRYLLVAGFPPVSCEGWCSAENLKKAWMQENPFVFDVVGGKAVVESAYVAQLFSDWTRVREGGE